MDFLTLFQLRTKRFWWMDVIFYFVISLFLSVIFSYIIFLTKNNLQREEIKKQIDALQTVGTLQQKQRESEVFNYQKKINDFNKILNNHQFTSSAFAFLESQTLPNVWFKQFNLDPKNNGLQLAGETEDIDSFSRQIAVFEKNKYVKNIGNINSALGALGRMEFNLNLVLDPSIFDYFSNKSLMSEKIAETKSKKPTPEEQAESTEKTEGGVSVPLSSGKLITSFRLPLVPEVVGIIDQKNYIITLKVPYGTNIKELKPIIGTSAGATVSPASGAPQNFTNPVIYTVKARDGSTRHYTVKVVVEGSSLMPTHKKSKWLDIFILLLIIVLVAVGITIFFLRKKLRNNGKQIYIKVKNSA